MDYCPARFIASHTVTKEPSGIYLKQHVVVPLTAQTLIRRIDNEWLSDTTAGNLMKFAGRASATAPNDGQRADHVTVDSFSKFVTAAQPSSY